MLESEIAAIVENGDRLGRAVFQGSWKEMDVVLKLIPPAQNWQNRLSRKIVGSSLPFLNEFYVNAALRAGRFSALQVPALLDGSPGKYLVFQRLHHETDSHDTPILQQCSDALFEFNTMDYRSPLPVFQRMLLRILEAPAYRIIRLAIFRRYPWRRCLKLLVTVLHFELIQRPIFPVLLHNDLAFSNVAITPGKGIVFLDFEDAVHERKWVLADAIDLEFDRRSMSIKLNVVMEYWRRLIEDSGGSIGKLNFSNQIRMGVLSHILRAHNNSNFAENERRQAGRFLDTLLDARKFSEWFQSQN